MLPLYAHETQGHMCKHADVHYTEQKVLRVALRRWGDDESVLRHWSHSRRWHHTVSKISGEKKNGAVYVVQAAEVNHDGARPPSRPPTTTTTHPQSPPGVSYLRRGEEAHSQEKMAWEDGRACVPGIPQYTVDTLLWHLQGQQERYNVIWEWEKVVLSTWLPESRGKTTN